MGTLQYGRNRLTIVATQTVRQEVNLQCATQVMTQTVFGIVFRPSLYIDDCTFPSIQMIIVKSDV